MKKQVICLFVGIFIGWATVPILRAESNDVRGWMSALRRIISSLDKAQNTLQEIDDNTKAIKEKLGAK